MTWASTGISQSSQPWRWSSVGSCCQRALELRDVSDPTPESLRSMSAAARRTCEKAIEPCQHSLTFTFNILQKKII